MRIATTLAVLALTMIPQPVLACGFCGGDKAASVYSFKNLQFAKRNQARYVSAELTGEGGEAEFEAAVKALARIDGVYPATVRTAYAQKAVSFVFRSERTFEEIARAFADERPGWSMKSVENIQ